MATPVLGLTRSSLMLGLAIMMAPLSAFGCVESWLAELSYSVVGEATSSSGNSLYRESLRHTAGPDGGTLKVDYHNPDDKLIATKTVNYNCHPTTPSFDLLDLVTGTREGVRWGEEGVQCYRGDDVETLALPDSPAIVDAGFDNAIKLSWDALMAGNTIRFQYLFNKEQRFLKLRLVRTAPPDSLREEVGDDTVFFKIAANNMFLRMFADSIYVGYDRKSRALRYYIGPSNLPAMADQEQVIIRYRHAS